MPQNRTLRKTILLSPEGDEKTALDKWFSEVHYVAYEHETLETISYAHAPIILRRKNQATYTVDTMHRSDSPPFATLEQAHAYATGLVR